MLVRTAYDALGLQTFFTAGPQEIHAWTVSKGSTAPQAAGVIHTDFEKGFIKAEIFAYNDLIKHGSEERVRQAGLYRTEGKEYSMKEGDIVLFRFNV
jgi:ribosome-binding ATPase YchF (GTP1/OBG family)